MFDVAIFWPSGCLLHCVPLHESSGSQRGTNITIRPHFVLVRNQALLCRWRSTHFSQKRSNSRDRQSPHFVWSDDCGRSFHQFLRICLPRSWGMCHLRCPNVLESSYGGWIEGNWEKGWPREIPFGSDHLLWRLRTHDCLWQRLSRLLAQYSFPFSLNWHLNLPTLAVIKVSHAHAGMGKAKVADTGKHHYVRPLLIDFSTDGFQDVSTIIALNQDYCTTEPYISEFSKQSFLMVQKLLMG